MKNNVRNIFRDGYTIRETAEILKINERTVKYKSKHAIVALKKMMNKKSV